MIMNLIAYVSLSQNDQDFMDFHYNYKTDQLERRIYFWKIVGFLMKQVKQECMGWTRSWINILVYLKDLSNK